jgi:hypothetical protein
MWWPSAASSTRRKRKHTHNGCVFVVGMCRRVVDNENTPVVGVFSLSACIEGVDNENTPVLGVFSLSVCLGASTPDEASYGEEGAILLAYLPKTFISKYNINELKKRNILEDGHDGPSTPSSLCSRIVVIRRAVGR